MKLYPHQIDAVKNGYFFECACGEIHRTEQGARICRKCVKYLVDYHDREDPIDLRKFIEAT